MSSSFYNGSCKGCNDRSLGCHGSCATYNEWKTKRDKIKKDVRKRRELAEKLDEADLKRLTKKWRAK